MARSLIEDQLDQLSALRQVEDPARVRAELGKALASGRSNLLAARAAKIAAELGLDELTEAMVTAFDRLMHASAQRDKGCLGKTALARALVELDQPASEVFRVGLRHVQPEPSWGGSVDTAAELRGLCAQGLAASGHPDAILEIVPLLVDKERPARQGAARALGDSGRVEAEPLLRLKVVTGDEDLEVLAECFDALLRLDPRRSIGFVAGFLDHDRDELAESAALALGESRLDTAIEPLGEALDRRRLADPRSRTLCLALAMLRRREALDRLLAVIATGPVAIATQALEALALHRHDDNLRQQLEETLAERDVATLWRVFNEELEG